MGEKNAKHRIIYSLTNATIVMILVTVLSMMIGKGFFGGIISITGFALAALLFYAVK